MEEHEWYLRISEAEFKGFYGETVDIELFKREPEDNKDLLTNFLPSKLWRLNNLYMVIDKEGDLVKFNMNPGQHKVYAASIQHPRLIVLKSRQQGISTFWLISYFDDSLTLPNLAIGLMAQGLDESGTLLKRVKTAWDNFPDPIRRFLGSHITRDNINEIEYGNKSTIFIRTSFRSTTLHRLHISEYGKIANKTPERAHETKTGTLQTIKSGNPVVIESTAEGDNDFKAMWNQAIATEIRINNLGTRIYPGKSFKPVFLSWLDDPDCVSTVYQEPNAKQREYFDSLELELTREITLEQRNFWIMQYEELGDATFQEYPATPAEAFAKSTEGCYYATAFMKHVVNKGRIRRNLYEQELEVNVAIDLGIREEDLFTMVYFQVYGNEYRIIKDYQSYNQGFKHYVDHMNSHGYRINKVIVPHDAAVRELGAGDGEGQSRYVSLKKLGVRRLVKLKKVDVAAGIELVRQAIPDMYIDESCEYSILCMQNYSRMYNEHNKTFGTKPEHNKWSHGADAIRYMAMARIKRMIKEDERYTMRRQLGVVDGLSM